jgi:dTDP-4-dehydrorhamnose 3,5-epimerase-like enzyme
MYRPSYIALVALTSAWAGTAFGAQSSGQREAFFRCKDATGQTHYGDSMPPACRGLDTEVLNERGMLVRIIEGEASRVARQAREAEEARLRKIKEEALQRDRMLIDTYLTVADIERLRDQRMAMLQGQYRLTETNIANMRDRQQRLQTQIARFKPYSDKPDAPPLPDHLAEELVNTVNSIRVYEEALVNNRQEQEEVKAAFEADIKRFKELKGLK